MIPEVVKISKENGAIKEMSIDSLEIIGELANNPKIGHKAGYDDTSWFGSIPAKRILEKSHWVWINKEVIGRNNTYEQQLKLVEEENKKTLGANISGLIDTVISIFMEYIRFGERNFIWNPAKINNTIVRVNEQMNGGHLTLSFTPAGLYVGNDANWNHPSIGFVVARKSFGSCTLASRSRTIFERFKLFFKIFY